MTTRLLAVVVVALAMSFSDLAAQRPPTPEESRQREDKLFEAGRLTPPATSQTSAVPEPSQFPAPPVVPLAPEGVKMAPSTEAAYQEALRDYFEYFKVGHSHRRDVFAWQLFSSRIIFWVVLSLVALGMYFAAMQFRQGLRRPPVSGAEEVTELAASLSGVKVRSPVLGVVILVISFAFFYLYLSFVYPIETTF